MGMAVAPPRPGRGSPPNPWPRCGTRPWELTASVTSVVADTGAQRCRRQRGRPRPHVLPPPPPQAVAPSPGVSGGVTATAATIAASPEALSTGAHQPLSTARRGCAHGSVRRPPRLWRKSARRSTVQRPKRSRPRRECPHHHSQVLKAAHPGMPWPTAGRASPTHRDTRLPTVAAAVGAMMPVTTDLHSSQSAAAVNCGCCEYCRGLVASSHLSGRRMSDRLARILGSVEEYAGMNRCAKT